MSHCEAMSIFPDLPQYSTAPASTNQERVNLTCIIQHIDIHTSPSMERYVYPFRAMIISMLTDFMEPDQARKLVNTGISYHYLHSSSTVQSLKQDVISDGTVHRVDAGRYLEPNRMDYQEPAILEWMEDVIIGLCLLRCRELDASAPVDHSVVEEDALLNAMYNAAEGLGCILTGKPLHTESMPREQLFEQYAIQAQFETHSRLQVVDAFIAEFIGAYHWQCTLLQ